MTIILQSNNNDTDYLKPYCFGTYSTNFHTFEQMVTGNPAYFIIMEQE